MGYTHYWRATKNAADHNQEYGSALDMAIRVVQASPVPLAGPLSDAGTKPELGDGIAFNGVGDEDGHETFYLPSNSVELEDFQFCKTARKPYDVVVTAVLATLHHFAPGVMEVSSDGDPDEWVDGVALASKVLGVEIPVPSSVEA